MVFMHFKLILSWECICLFRSLESWSNGRGDGWCLWDSNDVDMAKNNSPKTDYTADEDPYFSSIACV